MNTTEKPPISRLISYMHPFRRKVAWASFCSVANKIFDIMPEILIGMAIDVVVRADESFLSQWGVKDPWQQILLLGALTFVIWVGESVFEYLYMIEWRGLAQRVQHELRTDTYSHLQQLDLRFFEDQSSGNLTTILNDDINQLERFLDGGASKMIQTLTAVLGVGAVFFVLSPTIAVVAFCPIPLILFGAFYFQKKAIPLYASVREKVGLLGTRINNNISGIQTIKSFTQEALESRQLESESWDYVVANKKAIAVSSAFVPVIRMGILSGFLATFLLGAHFVFSGQMEIGAYGVLVFLTQRLLWPLTGVAETVDLYERAMASTRRILDLRHQPILIQNGTLTAAPLQSGILFDKINFQYSSGPQILSDVNFEVPARKTTAFVGSTGSGKSTLVKLLLRFYLPQQGSIKIDGTDLADIEISSWRKQVGLVSQDVFLFHGTVRENLLYGKPDATDDEIIKAARSAEAMEFIEKLPEGLNTIIGERGQKLSGGQRQRLSLARALLKDPPVLILDEATSAVDNETEAAIQRSLNKISTQKTVIAIAHRLSTIVNADCIYVLENGAICQQGRHQELIEKSGVYQNLWKVQTGAPTDPTQ